MPIALFSRLDARDRQLFLRCVVDEQTSRLWRRTWIGLTMLGSAGVTIAAVVIPPLLHLASFSASRRAGLALLVSHLVIQVVKRLVGRERPSETFKSYGAIRNPDRF